MSRTPFRMGQVLIALVALPGCLSSGTDYTRIAPKDIGVTNAVRTRIGIRPIKTSWTYLYREFGQESWQDGQGRLCKVVKRDDRGRIAWESDNYYSGLTFISPDPDEPTPMPEFFVVHYEYGLGRFFLNYSGTNPAIKRLLESLRLAPYDPANPHGVDTRGWAYQGESDRETLAVADQVLLGWKMTRSE